MFNSIVRAIILLSSVSIVSCSKELKMLPKKIPHKMSIHDDLRIDNYFWMKERDTKPVLDFLKAENERTKAALKTTEALQTKLVTEMRARIKEDDSSVPVENRGFLYYSRFETGGEYPIYARKKGSMEGVEQILVNGNVIGKKHDYFDIGAVDESTDQRVVGYAIDTVGRRFYDLHFKEIETGKELPDIFPATTGNFAWANDNKTIFFVKQHPETLRAYQLFRVELGSKKAPELVFEEKDETYSLSLEKSKTEHFLFLNSSKRDSTEVRFLNAGEPKAEWRIYAPRQEELEYSLEDAGDQFFIMTNWKAPNYRIMSAAQKPTVKEKWKEILPADPKIYREGLDVYKNFFVVQERQQGLHKIRVIDRSNMKSRLLDFPDPAYVVELANLPNYESLHFRFTYQSLNRPLTVFEENLASAQRKILKVRDVPTFDASQYESKRLWAKAVDGTEIPISLLSKKGLKLDGTMPLLLEGYGSYGYSNDPEFHRNIFSLVDRGFIYAIAHIRGGAEMGRHWYEEGRLKHKRNTFTDFIAAAEHLIQQKYTSPKHLYIWGGSAGGLLMGAVTNMRPDLFHGVVAAVPFVDVLTTMLDETLPLTTAEYREWGDPRVKEDYLYMKTYSPYDNVEVKNYPNILVTTGYHDSQVQYWEPAKWVAKLRECKADKNLLLLYTEMSAGHGGASGRFEALKNSALEYAFYLHLEGITK
jgi:oligopeptidase B